MLSAALPGRRLNESSRHAVAVAACAWLAALSKQDIAATGVTNGSILPGIKREPGWITTETILMRSKTGSVRRVSYRNPFE